jgi:hypothetical protein
MIIYKRVSADFSHRLKIYLVRSAGGFLEQGLGELEGDFI